MDKAGRAETLDELASSLARLHTSDSHHRRLAKKHYEKQRSLENAIRRHVTGACGCRGPKQCLSQLAKLVPINARPKYGQRKRVTAKK